MHRIFWTIVATAIALTTSTTTAFAVGPLGTSVPIVEGGLLGLVAAGVVGGVWIARRKR